MHQEDSRYIPDKAWNARNKWVADEKMFSDVVKYGCENQSSDWKASIFCHMPPQNQASIMLFGVRYLGPEFEIPATLPHTEHDIAHAEANPKFIECEIPSMTHIRVEKSSVNDTKVYATYWNYKPGCVSDITVDYYTLIWTDINGNNSFLNVSGSVSQFTKRVSSNSPDIILLKAGYIVPNDRKFMGYSTAVNYALQEFNIRY